MKVFDIEVAINATHVELPRDVQVLDIVMYDKGFCNKGLVFTVLGTPEYLAKTKIYIAKRGEDIDFGDRMSTPELELLGVAKDIRQHKDRGEHTCSLDLFIFKEASRGY